MKNLYKKYENIRPFICAKKKKRFKNYIPLIFKIFGFGFFVFGLSQGFLYSENQSSDQIEISEIRIEGNGPLAIEPLRAVLPIDENTSIQKKEITLTREIIQSYCRNQGYLTAIVTSTITVGSAMKHELVILINLGPQYHFGRLTVNGLTTLPEYFVHLEKTFEEGDPFNKQELFRTQSHLYLTGLLESIRIKTSTTTQHSADVTIDVEQKRLRWLKGGVGWGSEEKERLTLILLHQNVFRRMHRVELTNTLSRIWEEYRVDYVIPYYFATRTENRSSLSWRAENRDGYDYERILGSYSLGRQLSEVIKGSIGYTFNRNLTYNVNPEIAAVTADRSDGRSVFTSLNRDTTNDLFYPSHGSRTNIRLERSGGILGGNIHFNKISGEINSYEGLWKQLVGAFALRGGYVHEFSDSKDVPIFERFFTGGANSVRGYKERFVGPKDSLGDPLGGRWKLGSTAELRFPLFWKFSGAIFLDGGQVGPDSNDVDISQWKWGSGAGIRIKTPVGPIRLDYGYKLNRDTNDNSPWRIHFSLGESF